MIYGENNYSKLVNLAEQKIEIIMNLEDEESKIAGFYNLITGFGQAFEIKRYKGDVQNYQAVIDGVYNYYNKHPEQKINIIFNNSIIEYLIELYSVDIKNIDYTINIFEYIHDKQEKKEAPFVLDIKRYMQLLKERAISIKNVTPQFLQNVDVDKYLEERTHYFEEGHPRGR